MLGLGFNTALDSEKYLTLNTFTTGNYNHQVSYLDPKQYTEEKSATNSMNLMENLSLSYRKDWFQMSLNGNVNYQHSRNNVMSNNNIDICLCKSIEKSKCNSWLILKTNY